METTYTASEMLALVRMHFDDAFSSSDYKTWDWSLPTYLIQGISGWSEERLAAIVDFYHNGPSAVR